MFSSASELIDREL